MTMAIPAFFIFHHLHFRKQDTVSLPPPVEMNPAFFLRLCSGRLSVKPICPLTILVVRPSKTYSRLFTSSGLRMSFSNADTGSKSADPYKAKNMDDAPIKEKVEDLSEFISACKFGMMTTRDGASGRLVSRCMALAAKVHTPFSRSSTASLALWNPI